MATYAQGLKDGYEDQAKGIMKVLEDATLTDAQKLDRLWWRCADRALVEARRRDMVKP